MFARDTNQLNEPLNPTAHHEPPTAASTLPSDATNDSANMSNPNNASGVPQEESYVQIVKHWKAERLIKTLRYVNVVLAIMQAFAGFSGIFDLVVLDITSFLISVYSIVFALLLLAFECRFASMEPTIRQYFGFLFTYRGRTTFLFFVGFMNFGMNGSFAKLVGILMCANAIFEMLIISCHPEFKNGHLTSTMDPTASYTGASEETVQLLAQNQAYAAKAGAYVLQQAQQNPQFVAQAVAAPNGGYVPPPVVSH
jgi:hypothetical protein